MTTIAGGRAHNAAITGAWRELNSSTSEATDINSELAKVKALIDVTEKKIRSQNDPKMQLACKIEDMLLSLFMESRNETFKDLLMGFKRQILRDEQTEDFLTSVQGAEEILSNHLNKITPRELSFASSNQSESEKDRQIAELTAKLSALQATLDRLQASSDTSQSSQVESIRAEARQSRRSFSNSTAIVSYSASLRDDDIIEVRDDFTGDKIALNVESIDQILDETGKLDQSLLKGIFDDNYMQSAVDSINDNTDNILAVISDLEDKAVEIKAFNQSSYSDESISQLNNSEKAKIFISSLKDITKDNLESSNASRDALIATTSQAIQELSEVTASNVLNRVDLLSSYSGEQYLASLPSDPKLGVSAGDEARMVYIQGVWVSGIYASAQQKAGKKTLAYNSKIVGGTIGFDVALNDSATVGLAYNNAVSKIKGKSANSHINGDTGSLSLYGRVDLSDKLDVSLVISGGKTAVKHKYNKSIGAHTYKTASKFNTRDFGVHSSSSYKIAMNNGVLVSPNIGFRYNQQNDNAYTETGSNVHNLSVAAKYRQELVGIIGTKISKQFLVNDIRLIASLTASVEHNFNVKSQKSKINYTWTSQSAEREIDLGKSEKFAYNLGGNIAAIRNNIELSANYNCRLKKKYVGHQGTLKLKVMF